MHMLFTFPRAQQIWEKLGIGQTLTSILQSDRSGSVQLEQMILNLRTWYPTGYWI
jgi:hypothetical protein